MRVRARQRGAVLVVVMMVMMGLLGLGITASWLTAGNVSIVANTNMRAQAFYTAEAGIERAMAFFNATATMPDIGAVLTGSNPGKDNVPTGFESYTGKPNGVGAVLVDSRGVLWQVQHPGNVAAASSMGKYTVWVRNDTAELRKNPPMFNTDANRSVIVRSQGVARDGRTTVVLEVALNPASVVFVPKKGTGPVLCMRGKNGCDDNSSVEYGVVYD